MAVHTAQIGQLRPDGAQRLLNISDWDEDAVRDDVRDFVVETIGEPDGVLICDDTGFPQGGSRSSGGVHRHRGRRENGRIGTRAAEAAIGAEAARHEPTVPCAKAEATASRCGCSTRLRRGRWSWLFPTGWCAGARHGYAGRSIR